MSVTRSQGKRTPQEEALVAALATVGVAGRVETRGNLAVLVTGNEGAALLADPDVRRRALAAAREAGFTHLAVELMPGDPRPDAPVSRD